MSTLYSRPISWADLILAPKGGRRNTKPEQDTDRDEEKEAER